MKNLDKKEISDGVVHKIPADLRKALTADKAALAKWEDITPLARNEWICWTIFAKTEETRRDHVQRVVSELKEGIRRPCCWIGCIHRTDKAISPSVQGILSRQGKKSKMINNNEDISKQIDAIIKKHDDWRGKILSRLRTLIRQADPAVLEEVKWKMPSNPEGVPVWSHNGIVCIGGVLKNSVRLTFSKGAQMKDPKKLFNASLNSKTDRGIDFQEGDKIDEKALKNLVRAAVVLNLKGRVGSKSRRN